MCQNSIFIILILLCLNSCLETQSSKQQQEVEEASVEDPVRVPDNTGEERVVMSLAGQPLPPKPLDAEMQSDRRSKMLEARSAYEKEPQDLLNIIWYGRRLAYLGEFYKAIHIYSVGLDIYPDSYQLLRHRGHRYITVRELDEAIEDLQRAAFYVRPSENIMEEDGIPNRYNKPLSNIKFNVWYHLGVAYYIKGNYDKAISSFKQCLNYCDNDDLLVACTDWFYMTYTKIGNMDAANELLKPIKKRMNIIQNFSYHKRLLLYKGTYDVDALLKRARQPGNALYPTLSYGIATWYLAQGQKEEGVDILRKILNSPNWDSFGRVAAEADLIALGEIEVAE